MKHIVWYNNGQIRIYEPDGRIYRSTSYSMKLNDGINYLSTKEFNSIVWGK